MLEQHGVAEKATVRLVREREGVTLQSDAERLGDLTFEHGGRTVLVLDAQISELLSESTLDIEESKLSLRHPTSDA
jgi:hypothetical protein